MASVGTLDCCLRPYSHVVFPCLWSESSDPCPLLMISSWLPGLVYIQRRGKIPRLGFDQLAFSSHYKCMGASTMGGGIPCIRYMYLSYHIEVVGSTSMWERWHIHRIHCVFSSTLEVLKLLKCYFSTPKNKNIHIRGAKPKKIYCFLFAISSFSLFSLSDLAIGISELKIGVGWSNWWHGRSWVLKQYGYNLFSSTCSRNLKWIAPLQYLMPKFFFFLKKNTIRTKGSSKGVYGTWHTWLPQLWRAIAVDWTNYLFYSGQSVFHIGGVTPTKQFTYF